MKSDRCIFANEADLCRTFTKQLPAGWMVYSETGGFDIVLSRNSDGCQIGIEAKLTLNAKVISQITEDYWDATRAGPDFRAVLIPFGTLGSFGGVCALLGITVIQMKSKEYWETHRVYDCEKFNPRLPEPNNQSWGHDYWHDWCPSKRVDLPEYVPDVDAGNAAPLQLTSWKIKAIKLVVMLESRGFVTREDFRFLQLDHRRWMTPGIRWLNPGKRRGEYVAGEHLPNFRTQHPINFEQIKTDAPKWMPKVLITS